MQENEQQTNLPTEENLTQGQTGEQQTQPTTGKMFTQDEVNAIVQNRLSKQKDKAENTSISQDKETELTARENKLGCREYISLNNYPTQLLEIFDTSNAEQFKDISQKLLMAFPKLLETNTKPSTTGVMSRGNGGKIDKIANAFKPKI